MLRSALCLAVLVGSPAAAQTPPAALPSAALPRADASGIDSVAARGAVPDRGLPTGDASGRVAPDSGAAPRAVSPRATVQRAFVAPGWGQLTNRQPLKAVVVWAALGGTAGAAAFVHGRYREAGRAYLFKACTDVPATCKVPEAATAYADDYARRYDGLTAVTVRQSRDRLRRNRDLLALGVGLVYALQAADAYVAAHLLDFDEDERLSVYVAPSPEGPRLALRLTLP